MMDVITYSGLMLIHVNKGGHLGATLNIELCYSNVKSLIQMAPNPKT